MRSEGRHAWLFVVDTNQYAGNFEREMGAYLTGRVWKYFSDDAVALANLYKKETGDLYARRFVAILGRHKSDGEHWPNYTKLWETPGWFNNGVGGHFRDGQEAEALKHHRNDWLNESRARHLSAEDRKEYRRRAEEPLFKWPSGMSVAIAFTERPTVEQIAILEKRAKSFPDAAKRIGAYLAGPVPKITGTRLLRRDGEQYEAVPI